MTISEMLGQSALLTGLGMAVVFTFLIIMIICMTISAKVIKKLGLDKEEKNNTGSASAKPAGNNNAVVAAIAAAVREKQNQ
jgi:oxaloacetate decarboxylase gamma subunit